MGSRFLMFRSRFPFIGPIWDLMCVLKQRAHVLLQVNKVLSDIALYLASSPVFLFYFSPTSIISVLNLFILPSVPLHPFHVFHLCIFLCCFMHCFLWATYPLQHDYWVLVSVSLFSSLESLCAHFKNASAIFSYCSFIMDSNPSFITLILFYRVFQMISYLHILQC